MGDPFNQMTHGANRQFNRQNPAFDNRPPQHLHLATCAMWPEPVRWCTLFALSVPSTLVTRTLFDPSVPSTLVPRTLFDPSVPSTLVPRRHPT